MYEPQVHSKWLLASALHKSIRRGRPQLAHEYADRLRQVNPAYLTFRLGVVALEDVGPPRWELIAETYEAIRDRKLAALPDLAAQLAEGPKSRTVCFAGIRPPGDTLDLPPLLRFVAAYGDGFERLGRNVPHVVQLIAESESTEVVVNEPDPHGDELIVGYPAAVYDQHTSPGKFAIRQFHRALGTSFTVEQIGITVFFVEGAHLDKEFMFDGAGALRIDGTEFHYRKHGLTSRDQMRDLVELVRQNRELLNAARRRVLEAA